MKMNMHRGNPRFGFAFGFASLLIAQAAWAWPDLNVVKTGPAQAAPGDLINYTLTYSNAGPVNGVSVVLKDFLPAYTTVLTNTLGSGTLSGSTISWSLGTVTSHTGGSRSFQVRVSTNTPSGLSLTNRAQVFGTEAEEPGKTNDNYSTWITRIINRPPVAQNDSYTINEDTVLTVAAPGVLTNDSDPDGNILKAILVTGTVHGTLTLGTNGSFTYTPATNYNGGDSFTYKANDGITNSGIATVTITVLPVNDAPVAVNDSYTTPEDTTLNITAPGVLANDSDPDGDALKAILVTGPAHGILTLNSNGGFSYTPANNYVGGDNFTYKANDGTANSGIATANITVTPVNDRPVALNDAYTTPEDTALNISAPGVLGNDSDADGDALTAMLLSNPTHGTLTFNTDGSSLYMTLAALFVAQATNTHLTLLEEMTIFSVATLTSKGASGVQGAAFIALVATLSVIPTIPVAGMALILGIDRFMSMFRALVNMIGNGVATLVVARWENELDREALERKLA